MTGKPFYPFRTLFITTVLTLICSVGMSQEIMSDKDNITLLACKRYISDNNNRHIKEFVELAAIPSISSASIHKPDVEHAAIWIKNKLKDVGMTNVAIIPTAGNPLVFASWENSANKTTVLIYAHYDVQPVKESEWSHPPFQPAIEGGNIYARGISDDKSGVMIPIWAVETLLNTKGSLPVNVKFIFEGEEEMGSPHFRDFLIQNKSLLKADFALNADGSQINDSISSILMSLRGGAKLEFTVKTANVDAHSGWYGGKTPNAAIAMSQIISSFYNKDGSVAIEGFYDHVIPETEEEKRMVRAFRFDSSVDRNILGTTAETGDINYSPLERVWYRPTLEVTGLQSGYTGDGFAQIIPGMALARISARLVNNQSPPDVIQAIVKHINKNCPVGATVAYHFMTNYIRPVKFPSGTKAYTYLSDVLTQVYGRAPLAIGIGYSTGSLIDISEQLGIYPYSLGVQQQDEKAHAANEFLRISSIMKGELLYCNYFIYVGSKK